MAAGVLQYCDMCAWLKLFQTLEKIGFVGSLITKNIGNSSKKLMELLVAVVSKSRVLNDLAWMPTAKTI